MAEAVLDIIVFFIQGIEAGSYLIVFVYYVCAYFLCLHHALKKIV